MKLYILAWSTAWIKDTKTAILRENNVDGRVTGRIKATDKRHTGERMEGWFASVVLPNGILTLAN
jgi:hypothetical protein